jgi:hypothetical protein
MQKLESGYSDITLQIPVKIISKVTLESETEQDGYRKKGLITASCDFNDKHYTCGIYTSLHDVSNIISMRIIQQLKTGLLEQIKQDIGLE